jgi:hypothetical protein
LAGAILRRGSALAPLRAYLSHEDGGKSDAPERDGVITVKLFNLLAPELAPGFLHRGILLPAAEAEAFLRRRPPAFWDDCREILLDGKRIGPDTLKRGGWTAGMGTVALSVEMREA